MAELLRHPSALMKLQAEMRMIVNGRQHITGDDIKQMKYLKAVIMETFRLHPPFPIILPQVAMHDVNVMGFDIAKGTAIYINVWAIGRDPKVWVDRPNEFVPERFVVVGGSCMDFVKQHDFKLVPFGAGRRMCPGEGLALTIAENLLANLLCKFDWALPEGVKEDDMDMNERTGLATHKKTRLLAFAKPHRPASLFVAQKEEEELHQDLILENEIQENEAAGAGAGGEEEYTEPPEDAKIFVGNLPYDVDSEKLAHLFEQAGVVEISEVIYNRETDQSRGFGFVTMSSVAEAEKAVEMFHSYEIGGRNLTVNKAAPRGSRPEHAERTPSGPSYTMYVGNLSWDMDGDRLEQVFSEHGKVLSARIVYDRESGRSRGFGFVSMSSESEMNDAIENLDGQSVGGRAIRVNVAEDRRKPGF